jgi:TRAP transporter TAXI family solute receptor
MKIFSIIATSIVVAIIGIQPAGAASKKYNFTLAGASPGGFWALIHAATNKAFTAEFPKSVLTYRTTGGGFANIALVSRKKVTFGLAHDAEIKRALDGTSPFKKPIRNLRAVAVIYNNVPMQIFVTKSFKDKYHLTSLADVAKVKAPVRLALNRRGNIVQFLGIKFLEDSGISIKKIKKWGGSVEYAGSRLAFSLMKDRRVDMIIGGDGFAPGRRVLEVARKLDIELLTPTEAVAKEVARQTGTTYAVLKAGTYKFQKMDIPVVNVTGAIIVNKDTSPQVTYDLAKALIEHINDFKSVHRALKGFTPKIASSDFIIPYHKGALKYYREVGLRK